MSDVVDLKEAIADANFARIQAEATDLDGRDLSDYALTGGAWVDALTMGVTPKEITMAFYESSGALEFERKLWAKSNELIEERMGNQRL